MRKLLELWNRWTPNQRLATVLALLLLHVVLFCAHRYGQSTAPRELYGFELTPEGAQEVAYTLTRWNVEVSLNETGSNVLVEPSAIPRLRMMLALKGLPRPGSRPRVPSESYPTPPSERQLNQRKQLEWDLAESIRQIEGILDARLLLALPEETFFKEDERPVTASVFLTLRPGFVPSPEQVSAIVHLTAFSVEGLSSENVRVVGSAGQLLQGVPDQEEGTPLEGLKTQADAYLKRRLEGFLDQVIGKDRAAALLDVDYDFSQVEVKRQDVGAPGEGTVIVGEQVKTEEYGAGQEGAEEEADLLGGGDESRNAQALGVHDRPGKKYRLIAEARKTLPDQSYAWTVHRVPRIRRITCSVAVDNHIKPDQLVKVRKLVEAAIGIDASRGDILVVESIPIPLPEAAEVLVPPPPAEWPWAQLRGLAPLGALLVLAAFALGRKRPRPRAEMRLAPGTQGPRTILDLLQDKSGLRREPEATRSHLTERLENLARTSPDHAVSVLKSTWLQP